jgi:choline transport protein
MVVLAHPEYELVKWRGTLLMWAVAIIPVIINVFARRVLGAIEVAAGIMHVVFLPVTIAVFVILAPRNPDSFVWDTFVGGLSGWKDSGVVFSVGLLGVITPLAGTSLHYQNVQQSNPYQQASMASSTWPKKSKTPKLSSPAP